MISAHRRFATALTVAAATLVSLGPVAAATPIFAHKTKVPTPVVYAVPRCTTLLAAMKVPTPDYISPYTKTPSRQLGKVPTTWYGSRLTMPVIAQSPGWIEIRLPQRPNGSTAWVRSSAATFSYTGFTITVNLATTHIQLFSRCSLILNAPVGVGLSTSPTPTGNFFVAYFASPPAAGYGPFVIVTSAHSNAITDWEQSGDAQIGIHGALGADAIIGTKGAHVSHGCVRMHLADQLRLRGVPLGTPVTIIT